MKRKVIKQANQAFTLTLPIDWVRKNKITEDSELEVTVEGKNLIIHSSGEIQGGSVLLELKQTSARSLHNQIAALYAKGYDEIIIAADADCSSTILGSLNSMIGFALVAQQKYTYTIRDISPINYPHLDEIFKRVFQMILLLYDAAIQDIFGKQEETLENLKTRDSEINKFCLYLERAINRMSYQDAINGRILFTYSFELERISDEIERLWRTNIKYHVQKTKEIKALLEDSKEALAASFDLYYQFNPKMMDDIYALREKVRTESVELKKLTPQTWRFIRHAVKIAEDAADLNHLTLMRKLG